MLHDRLELAAIVVLLAAASLAAQMPVSSNPINRAPESSATQMFIPIFKSADTGPSPKLGSRAAAEMRKQVADAFPASEVHVIPDEQRFYNGASDDQFAIEKALEPHDVKTLATFLRAEEYVVGSIERAGKDGFRVQAELVLTRDFDARQPLGVSVSKSMPDGIKTLVREMKEARKQIDGNRKCTNAARDGKFSEAITFARAAIALYPKATIARMCLAAAMAASRMPTDSIMKVAREILALDPRNGVAIKYLPGGEQR